MNRSTEPTDPTDLGLASRVLGGLPIINAVTDRLGLSALLAAALPDGDARVKVSSAAAIRLVVTPIGTARRCLPRPRACFVGTASGAVETPLDVRFLG